MRPIATVLSVLLILIRRQTFASVEIDNALIGVPEIDCHADTIEMRFQTKRKFTGKIYVQGHSDNPDCRVDYGRTTPTGEPVGGIRLHHGTCDMNRRRSVQPEGMEFSTVLVISFHPIFVTKTDRAFKINCMYRETAKSVDAGLTVSPIEPDPVAYDMPLPHCTYTIRKDHLDGPILHYAKVGEQVVHRWECESDVYGMLVHSCHVEDGQGEKQLVIDERGCHVDRIALGDPTYVTALNMAYRESNVFKFADRVGIRFACEIKLCIKQDGGCKGVTPPICNDFQKDQTIGNGISEHFVPYHDDAANDVNTMVLQNSEAPPPETFEKNPSAKAKRHIGASTNSSHDGNKKAANRQPSTVATDLISQYVYVLDTVDDLADAEFLESRPGSETAVGATPSSLASLKRLRFASPPSAVAAAAQQSVCVGQRTFAVLAVAIATAAAAAAVLLFYVVFRQIRAQKLLKAVDPPIQQISSASYLFK